MNILKLRQMRIAHNLTLFRLFRLADEDIATAVLSYCELCHGARDGDGDSPLHGVYGPS